MTQERARLLVPRPCPAAHSRYTLLFEAFAIRVLQAAQGVAAAAGLLGLDWKSLQQIIKRAVERGLERREIEGIKHLGFDEKSFGKGQDYISVMCGLGARRVWRSPRGVTRRAPGNSGRRCPKRCAPTSRPPPWT